MPVVDNRLSTTGIFGPVVDGLSTTGPKMPILTFYFFFLPLIAAPLHPCSLTPQQPRSHSPCTQPLLPCALSPCALSPCATSPCAPAPLRACSPAAAPLLPCDPTSLLLNTNTASRYIYIYVDDRLLIDIYIF
ncbi:hypothetical protein ACOSP7_007549 [Xanthoceras sorbifolium]